MLATLIEVPEKLICFLSTGLPKVRFLCGVTKVVGLERWVLKGTAGVYLSRQQLPLKLAWAISIHKSQVSDPCERSGQCY